LNENFGLSLVSVEFGIDEQVTRTERKKQTVPEVLSIVGGLMGFTMMFLKFLIRGIQAQMFNFSLMKQLFLYYPDKLESSSNDVDNSSVVKMNPT
jgi:hypothetical protein